MSLRARRAGLATEAHTPAATLLQALVAVSVTPSALRQADTPAAVLPCARRALHSDAGLPKTWEAMTTATPCGPNSRTRY